ncbi:ABC transporter permease protein [uncultured Desulfobacterium sp.]|uniref:ABC transporter permease protein n=1 Tax=uncultured Desulfobacterium sp. TaxID=201089 RepID=A0A445MWV9_9BACT|nr:ABC transporter permease protein [uncultured Desulfobacterium sp.]
MLIYKILIRNAFRNRLRAALTVIGIGVAILAFCLLRTIVGAWYAGVEASSATRLITRNAISIIFPLPLSYMERIRQIEGVEMVSYGNWFGGIYIDEKNFFPNFCVDPETYLGLYPEFMLKDSEKTAFFRDRKSCIVGRKLATRFGWKVNDIITLKGTIFPGNWDFVVRGIYVGRDQTIDETQFFFHWDYLNEELKKTGHEWADNPNFYIVGVKRPDYAATVSDTIDRMFKNSYAETLTETEKAFQLGFVAMTSAIVSVIQVVSFMVIVIIMAVAANTMAMTTRERIGEYATLKSLGFGPKHIATLVFGESAVISLSGYILGIAATYPAADKFRTELGHIFPVFNVEIKTVFFALLAAIAVAIVAGIVPTVRAAGISIADGLRRMG